MPSGGAPFGWSRCLPDPTEPLDRAHSAAAAATTAERVVEGARRSFERFGIRKTTIEDIARAAGVSRPTVYKHFASKMEIVDHLAMCEMDKVQQALRARLTPRSGLADRLTEVVLVSVMVARENLYVRRFVEEHEAASGSYLPSSPYQAVARERWHDLLVRARERGDLARDLDLDEVVVWLSMNQVMLVSSAEHLDEGALRRIVRRFVVEPLLARRI